MRFDHEKLDVYRLSIEFIAWLGELLVKLETRFHSTRDQLDRAGQSIALNIAEGNGKRIGKERLRFFEIARGSATECAAALDVLVARKAVVVTDIEPGKKYLFRIVSMLIKLAPPDSITSTSTKYEYESRTARSD